MNPEVYKKYGLDEDSLKAYWTSDKKNDKREKLKQLIAGRLRDGIDSGLRDHKIWWAIDLAYDAPFSQTTVTLLQNILSKKYDNASDVNEALKKWGMNLDEIVRESIDSNGNKKIVLNVPVFYKILIPLVKAYVTIRRSKLFNDRNLHPLFKYEPVRFTIKNRIIGEVITDVIDRISEEYGYSAVLKQAILQTLQYGVCIMFPQEEWHVDKQIVDAKGTEKTLREGLRYNLPHPSRMAWDKSSRLSTINTDTGVNWAFYWRVDTYGNLEDHDKYWNTKNIPYGAQDWTKAYPTYFTEVAPCKMAFPSSTVSKRGAGESDREVEVARYGTSDQDKGVFVTEFFMKIRPKKYGLGTYPHPTWMRFVIASDDTVMWNAPTPYNPMIYMGYDADDSRSRNSSMALEVLPFQDHLGNLLSQQLLSVKQNLTKAVFYDTDQVDAEQVGVLENMGQQRFNGVPYIPFSSKKSRVSGNDIKECFHKVDFPIQDTASIASTINSVIEVLERILVLSSQEIGQASTHEQTAEETRVIASNTSTRVTFTGSFIDEGINAWKKQLYRAARSYLDDAVDSQISNGMDGTEEVLKELGFEVDGDKSKGPIMDGKNKIPIKASMAALELETIIGSREGEDRVNSPAIATAGIQILQVALNNPMTAQAIGPGQALDLITQFAIFAGMPRDFKLKANPVTDPQQEQAKQMEQVKQFVAQAAQQIEKNTIAMVGQKMIGPVEQELKATEQKVVETEQVVSGLIDKIAKLVQLAQAPPQPNQYDPNQPPPALNPGVGQTPIVAATPGSLPPNIAG